MFSCFSVFTFLTVIVLCLFHGSSLLQGTHTLSAHHRQSARSHTGEFNLVVGIVCYKKLFVHWCCPLLFVALRKMFTGCWSTLYSWPSLQNGCRQVRCWKHAFFFAYDQLLPIPCNWPLNDRTLNSSLADAREAFINVCVDAIERWKVVKKHSFPPIEWSCTSRAPDSWCCRSLTPSSTCQVQCINQPGVLPSSSALKLLPLLVLAALKSPAFRWS